MGGRYQCFLSTGVPSKAKSKNLRIKVLKKPPTDLPREEVQHGGLRGGSWQGLLYLTVFVMLVGTQANA